MFEETFLFITVSPDSSSITETDSAFASDGKTLFSYTIPRLEQVINPIGCGDTASAVWLSEIVSGTEYSEAFRYALGCASANCLTAFPGNFVMDDALALAAQITIQRTKLA